MCALSFTIISLMNGVALALETQIFRTESSSWKIFTFDEYEVPLLVFFDNFALEVDFIQQNGYSSLFLETICLEICFPAFHYEVVSVFFPEPISSLLLPTFSSISFTVCHNVVPPIGLKIPLAPWVLSLAPPLVDFSPQFDYFLTGVSKVKR